MAKDRGSGIGSTGEAIPWEGESSRYMGACLAAIAAGSAP